MDFQIISYIKEGGILTIRWGGKIYESQENISPFFYNKLQYFIKNKWWPNVTRLIRQFKLKRTDASKIAKDGPHSYCCAIIYIPNLVEQISEWQINNITDDILIGDGLEMEPHITILYGLIDTYIQQIKRIANEFGRPIRLKLGLMSKFEHDREDILKIDIVSNDLKELNDKISKLPNENTYSEYDPHLTIGYFKKDAIDKFIGNSDFKDKRFVSDHFYVTDKDNKKIKINI
jgi:hypothetical protein